MSNLDPPGTTDTRTTYVPDGSAVEVRREVRPNRTAWVISGLVIIVAIVAVAVIYSRQSTPAVNNAPLAAATAQGSAQTAAQDAQAAAAIAQSNAQTAAQTAVATSASQAAADRAAAQVAARDAAASARQAQQTPSPASDNDAGSNGTSPPN